MRATLAIGCTLAWPDIAQVRDSLEYGQLSGQFRDFTDSTIARAAQIWTRCAPDTAGEEVPAGDASPAELFDGIKGIRVKHRGPVRVASFYAYDGSLTTPACTEGVRWSVLVDGGHVSPEAVAHLHQVIAQFPDYGGYPNNNRPLQPLNGRVVGLRRGR